MLKRRQEDIKEKGFNLTDGGVYRNQSDFEEFDDDDYSPVDFSKMRVGLRTIDNAVISLGSYKKVNPNYGNKDFVLRAIYNHDYSTLRDISNYFYDSNGIYQRLCNYIATLYRYDWYITPYIDDEKANEKKILKDFSAALRYLDKSNIKRLCGKIALEIMKNGVYYGIILDFGDKASLQQLPAQYCRCRYYAGDLPVIELNLQFFDAYFTNWDYKMKVLKTFPKDIQQAYLLFKQGKLKGDYPGNHTYWYALEPGVAIKFNLNDSDFPPFVGTIPSLIDLDQAQDLDRKKTMQQLLKIIIQKLPLDKNGDLIFDVDEAKDIHNNAVAMLKRAIGVDVLTTFADIEKIDTKDSSSQTTKDDLEKVERSVYNSFGVTRNLFNAEGNLAIANSILTDEANVRDMLLQFSELLNRLVEKFARKGHYDFRAEMLETTQFNYKELSKMYKEQSQMGFPLLLPQIALGQSQSSILAGITFESEVLNLAQKMQPPMTSNVQSAKNLDKNNQNATNKNQNQQTDKEVGRPEKPDAEKSDKTIQNMESQS